MITDWIWGLLGGLMIGAAGAVFLLVNGRIMGASGLLGGLIDGSGSAHRSERLAFLAGLVGVPMLFVSWNWADSSPAVANMWVLGFAGLLVGFGTRLGNGCTSGHGVCGISRLSLRSIFATVIYVISGMLAVILARYLGLIL